MSTVLGNLVSENQDQLGNYLSADKRTNPCTPRHNSKVERYQRILAEEVLYAREYSCEDERFPSNAAVPLGLVHKSVAEYSHTALRPAEVLWQHASRFSTYPFEIND